MITPQSYALARNLHPAFVTAVQNVPVDQAAPSLAAKLIPGMSLLDQPRDTRHGDELLRLYTDGYISFDDYERASIEPVATNALYPQMGIGGYVVIAWLNPDEVKYATGLIAVRRKSDKKYYYGRAGMGNGKNLCLLPDFPGYEPVLIPRNDVFEVYRIVYAYGHFIL